MSFFRSFVFSGIDSSPFITGGWLLVRFGCWIRYQIKWNVNFADIFIACRFHFCWCSLWSKVVASIYVFLSPIFRKASSFFATWTESYNFRRFGLVLTVCHCFIVERYFNTFFQQLFSTKGSRRTFYPLSHLVQLFLETFAVSEAQILLKIFHLFLHCLKLSPFWVNI